MVVLFTIRNNFQQAVYFIFSFGVIWNSLFSFYDHCEYLFCIFLGFACHPVFLNCHIMDGIAEYSRKSIVQLLASSNHE